MKLTQEEGAFLKKKMISRYPDSMLAYVVENHVDAFFQCSNFQELKSIIHLFPEKMQEDYYLALQFEASDGATVKIQTIGGLNDSRIVTLDSDMDAVIYVKSNKMKLRVTCELAGDVITRTLSFSPLKLVQ